jgi:hypothetical protein
MDRISNDVAGIAGNLYLNPNYNPPLNDGRLINMGGVLIEDVTTGIAPYYPAVSGVLYSFDYKVPEEAVPGQVINIFADPSCGAINVVSVYDSGRKFVTPESLSLSVIPEPATVLFLIVGIGVIRAIRPKSPRQRFIRV